MNQSSKKQTVLDLLVALVAGDRNRLKTHMSDECQIIYPGFSTSGHTGVDELFDLVDEAFDGCPTKTYDRWVVDEHAAVVSGTLQGRFKDGRSMDGTRYTDQFFFDNAGRVTHWLVWNDLALLAS